MKFVGLDNFKAILKDRHFSNAFSNNLIYLLINLCGQLGIALLLALLLSHLPHGNSFFKTIYFAPAILSRRRSLPGIQEFYSLDPPGLFNLLLQTIGLGDLQRVWLGNIDTALGSVALIECYKNMGIYLVIIYAGLLPSRPLSLNLPSLMVQPDFVCFGILKFPT